MKLEFSLAHLMLLNSSPTELIDIAEKTGYDFVSFRLTPVCKDEYVFPLLTDSSFTKKVKHRLESSDVDLLDIELARLGPGHEPEDYLYFLEVGAELGARHVICQLPDSNRERASDRFSRLCELAKPYGLTINLEFLPWSETSNISDAARIIEQSQATNGGILVDLLHFERSDSTLEQLTKLPRSWFNFVHLCDADKIIAPTPKEQIFTARCDRKFPGEGDIPIGDIICEIPQVPYSLEIPNDQERERLGTEEYARRAINQARRHLEIFQSNIKPKPCI